MSNPAFYGGNDPILDQHGFFLVGGRKQTPTRLKHLVALMKKTTAMIDVDLFEVIFYCVP